MSKELEAQITKAKEAVATLESQLKGLSSYFTSFTDEQNTQKKLAKQRLDLAILYKSNHQFNEALVLLQQCYEYYNDSIDSFDAEKSIEIIDIQAACNKSMANIKQQKANLSELLMKLPLMDGSKYKKNIATYLDEYITLEPNQDGLSKITYVIENININKNAISDSNTYKYALNLKAKLCCDLGDFNAAYEALRLLITHRSFATHYVSDEDMTICLNAYSMACYFKFDMIEKVQTLVEKKYDTNRYNASNFEIVFESKPELVDEEALNQVAFLYHHFKKTPPKWFPKCTIQEMSTHSFYKEANIHFNAKPIIVIDEEKNNLIEKINTRPEFEKIREKITLDWENFGVGGYKKRIKRI